MSNYIEEKLKEFDREFVKNLGDMIEAIFLDPNGSVNPIKQFIKQALQEQGERIREEEYQRRRGATSKAANVNYFSGYEKGVRDVKEKIEELEPSYSGVLDSNERRRGYELAWAEFREELLKELNI